VALRRAATEKNDVDVVVVVIAVSIWCGASPVDLMERTLAAQALSRCSVRNTGEVLCKGLQSQGSF
jgi:hypothetical protein